MQVATKTNRKLSVLLCKEGEYWVAQCLEVDIAAQARTLDDLDYELERTLIARISLDLMFEREPFEGLPAAPQNYWIMYERAKSVVPRRKPPFRTPLPVPLPRQEQRVY